MNRILVIGATGPQGRPVAEHLARAGYTVRAMVRDPSKAADLAALGIEIVTGDLDDPGSVMAAAEGQDGIFLLISFFTGTRAQAKAVIDAAKARGVGKIVWNATGQILPFVTGNPAIDVRRDILEDLTQSGIPFVALQPTVYMENFLIPAIAREVAENDVLTYPMPDAVQCQWISHRDAAAFAVAAFGTASTGTIILDISGPERLTGSAIAERMGKALGRTIVFRPMPPEAFAKVVAFGGNEAAVTSFYQAVFDNPDLMSTNVDYARVLEALPITPVTIEDWARIHRHMLTSSERNRSTVAAE